MKTINNHSLIIAISLFGSVLFMFCYFWYSFRSEVSDFKSDMRKQYKTIEKHESNRSIYFDVPDSSSVKISKKQLTTIIGHINDLKAETQKEALRAESIIDKDLDRLSLFMSVGIGFLSLLGVFVPLLINLNSKEEQKRISEKQDKVEEKLKLLDEKFKESDINAARIEELEKSNKILIKSTKLSRLQASIGRLHYIGPVFLYEYSSQGKSNNLKGLFEDLKNDFFNYLNSKEEEVITKEEIERIISDLISFLKSETFKFSMIFNKRNDIELFNNLLKNLIQVAKRFDKEEFSDDSKNLFKSFDKIIELF